MKNIVSYLEEFGHVTFAQMPFNEVDALVLSQFSYLKWKGLVPKPSYTKEAISLAEMKETMDETVVFSDERYEKNNRLLFERLADCKRFAGMSCNYYADIINEFVETQFCAITCFFTDMIPVVVFRGTDENLVGWKEDFNMAFNKPVPGQRLAALYLNEAGSRIEGEFIVCGHSKGGNLAVYSGMNVFDDIQKRIKRIYSFDGPGFRPEILNSNDYEKIAERIEKYIPQSSLVGMILENHEDYMVIESASVGLLQHDPYTWKVADASFIRKEAVHKSSQFMNETLNEWILKLNEEQLEVFVGTLFHILEGCDSKNLIDMAIDWKKTVSGMIRATKEVDEATKDEIQQILQMFTDVMKENLKKL